MNDSNNHGYRRIKLARTVHIYYTHKILSKQANFWKTLALRKRSAWEKIFITGALVPSHSFIALDKAMTMYFLVLHLLLSPRMTGNMLARHCPVPVKSLRWPMHLVVAAVWPSETQLITSHSISSMDKAVAWCQEISWIEVELYKFGVICSFQFDNSPLTSFFSQPTEKHRSANKFHRFDKGGELKIIFE